MNIVHVYILYYTNKKGGSTRNGLANRNFERCLSRVRVDSAA